MILFYKTQNDYFNANQNDLQKADVVIVGLLVIKNRYCWDVKYVG